MLPKLQGEISQDENGDSGVGARPVPPHQGLGQLGQRVVGSARGSRTEAGLG